MCNGVPSKPSPVISDQQGIDNQGLADKINGQAGSSGSGVIGTTTIAGDGSFFDRVGTGTGGRSTRHDLPGGDTPMSVEELWKFLMENKVELGHTTLDLLGLIPLFGEIADIANAAWYAAQGDYTMAGISIASAIPGLGWGGTAGKWGTKYGDEAIDAARAARGEKAAPNPWGRRGSPQHVARIGKAEQRFAARGWTTVSGGSLAERRFGSRYPDLVMQKDGSQIAIQVGRVTKDGRPVSRERRALEDLRRTGQFDHVFFLKYVP